MDALDLKIDRAWTLFLYASEDYQKALKAFEVAQAAVAAQKKELEVLLVKKEMELVTVL